MPYITKVMDDLQQTYRLAASLGTTHNMEELLSAMLTIHMKIYTADNIVEVGGFNGATSIVYSTILNAGGNMICIDPELQTKVLTTEVSSAIRNGQFIHINGYAEDDTVYSQVSDIVGDRKIQLLIIGVTVDVDLHLKIYEKYLPLMDRPSIVMIHDTYDMNHLMDPKVAFDRMRGDNQYIEYVNRYADGIGRMGRHGESLFILDNIGEL